MTEIYPIAHGIVQDRTASEREVCEFLGFARSPYQRWQQFQLLPLQQDDKELLPLIVKSFLEPIEDATERAGSLMTCVTKAFRSGGGA